ncbi:N-6 DNA methylase [Methylomonas albis]|uniref:site-specific DNA-methyltransferase (adenine-specific) n=1 Tax=Methylomonas albis TaxID=1854563 RepID=A0ABR9D018_9GAMM|nr:N-6 DNA methylase [Methylomonas albis]MBD9356151.1 N-6 DNA methylase [Methylomonas albis]
MKLSNSSKTSDRFGRYYTNSEVARVLVNSMGMKNPRIAIDLGTGNGSLVGEASRHWNITKFVTVDIDDEVSSLFHQFKYSNFTHYTGDALELGLSEKIGVPLGTVDSGLCNPPYIRPKWRQTFGEILEDAGLSAVIPKLSCIHADVLFLAQNLRFLRKGGKLGLILPDGLIAGDRYVKLRQNLTLAHRLERVIELPRGVFSKTDAKAHIVVLSKQEVPSTVTQIQRLEINSDLTDPIYISPDQAGIRLDYSFLRINNRINYQYDRIAIRNITELVTRGIYSSAIRKELNFPVFHSTDFDHNSSEVPKKFLLKEVPINLSKDKMAHQGDILIARVGRNLEEKICLVSNGYVAVTDCIFVLRITQNWRQKTFRFLTSPQGSEAVSAISHGVGAKFITKDALLGLEI